MATATYIPDAGIYELAQVHLAAMSMANAATSDDDSVIAYEAGGSIAEEAIARPIHTRHDAAGKLLLLKTLLFTAMGGVWMLHDGLEARLLDDVCAYLRADA